MRAAPRRLVCSDLGLLGRAASLLTASLLSFAFLGACGQDGVLPNSSSNGEGGSGASTATSTGAGGGGGAAPDPKPLSILNWNTHNFFNDKNDDASNQEYYVSTAEYLAKRKQIAGVINDLGPDIAVLQEIENASVLKDLNDVELAALGQLYTATALVPTVDTREITVLSKIPIDKVVSHKDEYFEVWGTKGPSYRYTRDCLEVHLTYNGRSIVILGIHFRSKVDPDDPDKRLAEAQHTRDIANSIAAANPAAGVVILGDFNDTPGSPPLAALIGTGEGAFTDAAVLVPETARWSYNYKGTLSLLDHQISNPILAAMLDKASVTVSHSPTIEDASDHAPVMSTYQIR